MHALKSAARTEIDDFLRRAPAAEIAVASYCQFPFHMNPTKYLACLGQRNVVFSQKSAEDIVSASAKSRGSIHIFFENHLIVQQRLTREQYQCGESLFVKIAGPVFSDQQRVIPIFQARFHHRIALRA